MKGRWFALALFVVATIIGGCKSVGPTASVPTAPEVRNLAPTPPMGFNNWVSFGCNVSEELIKGVADKVVVLGLRDAGYRYINIDDCWEADARDAQGRLQADPVRFPHGIKWLVHYVHARGLKFGIYSSIGDTTCTGHLGSGDHYDMDMATFAAWGVDYLKMDGCGYPPGFPELTGYKVPSEYCNRDLVEEMREMYEQAAFSIQRYAPDMVHAISAPASLAAIYDYAGCPEKWTPVHFQRSLRWSSSYGQLWRAASDSNGAWKSILSTYEQIIDLADFQRPGRWNDADSLSVGDKAKLKPIEEQTQFTLWSVMASPLLISADLGRISESSLAILSNRDVVAINQDPAGLQGRRVHKGDGYDVIMKPLADGGRAVVVLNKSEIDRRIQVPLQRVGLDHSKRYQIKDLISKRCSQTNSVLDVTVPAHGTAIYRFGACVAAGPGNKSS